MKIFRWSTGRLDFHQWKEPWARFRLRLAIAYTLSLCFHFLIISLQFGDLGFGLPGIAFPWKERREQASDISVRLENPQRQLPPDSASRPKPSGVTQDASGPTASNISRPALSGRLSGEIFPKGKAARSHVQKRIISPTEQEVLVQKVQPRESFSIPPFSPVERMDTSGEINVAGDTSENLTAIPVSPDSRGQAENNVADINSERPPAVPERDQVAAMEAENNRREVERDGLRDADIAKDLEVKRQEEVLRLRNERNREEEQRQIRLSEARRLADEAERSRAEERERQAVIAEQQEQERRQLEEKRKLEELQRQKAAIEAEERKAVTALEMERLRRAEEIVRQLAVEHEKELELKRQAAEAAAQANAREILERRRLQAQAETRLEQERLAAERALPVPVDAAGNGGSAASTPLPNLTGRDLALKALDQIRSRGEVRNEPAQLPPQPGNPDTSRRRSILGIERDVVLRMYVDSWRWRIERNGSLNYSHLAVRQLNAYPVVSVAIRKDGSLESVLVYRSSGSLEIDNAVRRIAQMYAPYSAFPPALARQFDVIEIRRVWMFDSALRIMEDVQ